MFTTLPMLVVIRRDRCPDDVGAYDERTSQSVRLFPQASSRNTARLVPSRPGGAWRDVKTAGDDWVEV